MNEEDQTPLHPDVRSLLTWLVSGTLFYLLFSGAFVYWLPFSVYSQYSVIVHTLVGIASLLPGSWIVFLHWRRRDGAVVGAPAVLANLMAATRWRSRRCAGGTGEFNGCTACLMRC